MAFTGLLYDRHLMRYDRNYTITGTFKYEPIGGLSVLDNSSQLATTEFVNSYVAPIIGLTQTGGNIYLTENKFYKIALSSAATFILPVPAENRVRNQIKVYLKLNSNLNINWGAPRFIGDSQPLSMKGDYILFYDWNPVNAQWAVGSVINGRL